MKKLTEGELKDIEGALKNLISFGVYNSIPIYNNPAPNTDRNVFNDIEKLLKHIRQLEKM